MKKILGVVLALCMVGGLTGCTNNFNVELSHRSEDANSNAPIVEADVCIDLSKSGNLHMKYDATYNCVMVCDNATGATLWSTAVDETYYGQEIKNNLIRNAIRQLITIAYTDYNNVTGVSTDTDGNCEKIVRQIDNGIRFDFNFKKIDIQISMELVLENDQLCVRIPSNSFKENGKYGVTRIDVLPMFGATNMLEEGYFFFPDGCGALYQFGTYMGVQKTISMDVYDTMNTEIVNEENLTSNQSNVCLPVFGISLDKKGLFANITSGAEDCLINLASAEGAYAVNRIYPSIRVRKQYPLKTASGEEVHTYQKKEYISDFEIIYDFLKDDTSYSAMANTYREYLIDNKILTKHESNSWLALDFLMGVSKESMFGGEDVLLTTFEDVSKILTEVNSEQNYQTKTVLYGWQKGGYRNYPSQHKYLKDVGSDSDLSKLCENFDVYLLNNYMDALDGNSGFSKQTDVVYSIGGSPLTDYKEQQYLLNPLTQMSRLENDLKIVEKVNAGIAFEGIGKKMYEDFDNKKRLTRYGYAEAIKQYLELATEKTEVCTDGVLAYFMEYSDYIINLPDDTSNTFLWHKEVPFLQMVLHGSVDYSASSPGNLSSDFEETKLHWIEYGYLPTFMMSGGRNSLLGTEYDLLFSSDYEHWKETINQVVDEFATNFEVIKGEYMISHQSENDVVTVKYSNGVSVIINYSEQVVEIDGVSINANDYLVIRN